MYYIAKCRNCGEIQPTNKIGTLCPFCGDTLVKEESNIDYDSLIDNTNIFNKDLSLFYSNFIPFYNAQEKDSIDIKEYQEVGILVLFNKANKNENINNERFVGIVINIKNKMYRICINLFRNIENQDLEHQVELKEININNLDPNFICKYFLLRTVNPLIEDLQPFNKKESKIYEMDILKRLRINEDKMKEYISFNRLLDIIQRQFGIEYIERNDSFLCSYDCFISHPNIYDFTKNLLFQKHDFINDFNLDKIPLKNTSLYLKSYNPNNSNYFLSNNFEESFIINFLATNEINNYDDLFNYFDNNNNNNKTVLAGTNAITRIDCILNSHFIDSNQYAIYKICKKLGYDTSLYFKYKVKDNKLINYFVFACIKFDDSYILLQTSKELKYLVPFYGINRFPNMEGYCEFIDLLLKKRIEYIDTENDDIEYYHNLEYNGDFIVDKSYYNEKEFFFSIINDMKVHPKTLKEDKQEDNFKRKRKEICEKIYGVMSILDRTGENTKKYQQLFEPMTDDQFKKYMKDFLKDENKNFYLEVLPNKNEPTLKEIQAALDFVNVPMNEYVYFRHDGNKNNPLRTRYKVPVGYIHIKRLQQMLQKKNTYSLSIDKRSLKTNQVTGEDKIARISDAENYCLSTINADEALKEFLGPRADGEDGKIEMYKNISNQGYTYLEDLPNDLKKKQTLNTINAYLIGSGITSDIIPEDFIQVKNKK